MMTNDDYQHFVCIVASDNPEAIIKEYDKNLKKDPYVKYFYKDAKKLHQNYITVYENILKTSTDDTFDKEELQFIIDDLKSMTDDEFFEDLTIELDIDEKTGDAYTTENANGKFSSYRIGKLFSIPFLTKDGREVFQCKKSDIDWDKIHLSGGEIYKRAWEMVMEKSEPENDYEQKIFENMQDKTTYFQKFESKENYIVSNTAFWGYAFLSEERGWMDASDVESQFVWMSNFYDLFIKHLSDDTLLTIYECRK